MRREVAREEQDSRKLELEYDILSHIYNSNSPVGSSMLYLLLGDRYFIKQATIGRKLQELEHKGYLEKRQNKGRVLTEEGKEYLAKLEMEANARKRNRQFLEAIKPENKSNLIDMLVARRALESEIIQLACDNIREEDFGKLSSYINRQEESLVQNEGSTRATYESVGFHLYIAKIAGNKVMEHLLNIILSKFSLSEAVVYIRKEIARSLEAQLEGHKNILELLKKRDKEGALKAIVDHINMLIDDVEIYWKEVFRNGEQIK